MTQPSPPLNAHVDLTPTSQTLNLYKVSDDPPVWAVVVQQPLVTHVILLDRAAGMDLANKLREQCSGLTVAQELPPSSSNGQGRGGGA